MDLNITDADASYQLSHINDSRQAEVTSINITLIVLSTAALCLRLASKGLTKAKWGYDDYAIVVAQLLAYLVSGLLQEGLAKGGGKHFLATGFDEILDVAKIEWIGDIAYTLCISATKTSILLFYYRIFPSRHFRFAVSFSLVFLTLAWISAVLVLIFACQPMEAYWNPTIAGNCINIYAFFVAEAGVTILTDIQILVLPMPMVWKLTIAWKQKMALTGIFTLGGIICIVSFIRVPTLHMLFSDDVPWTAFDPIMLSLVECNIGIVTACLPTMRPLLAILGRLPIFACFQRQRSGEAEAESDKGALPSFVSRKPSLADSMMKPLPVPAPELSHAREAQGSPRSTWSGSQETMTDEEDVYYMYPGVAAPLRAKGAPPVEFRSFI